MSFVLHCSADRSCVRSVSARFFFHFFSHVWIFWPRVKYFFSSKRYLFTSVVYSACATRRMVTVCKFCVARFQAICSRLRGIYYRQFAYDKSKKSRIIKLAELVSPVCTGHKKGKYSNHHHYAGILLTDYIMVWAIGWKKRWKIGKWVSSIGR